MDRGYLDFARLFAIHQAQAFFVIRAKSNTQFKRRYSQPVDRATTPVFCDQTVVLTVFYSSKDYPATLRRVVVKAEAGKRITFLTNNFALKPEPIAQLYRQPWQVELFFKWITHQGLPEHNRERGEDADLDCGVHLESPRVSCRPVGLC